MPGDVCPASCLCRRTGGAAVLLTLCAFAAVNGRIVLKDQFWNLLAAAVHSPWTPPLALVILAATAVAGTTLLITGIYSAFCEHDDPPVAGWLVASSFAAIALARGWQPWPQSEWWAVMAPALFYGILVGTALNVWLNRRSRLWWAAYNTGIGSKSSTFLRAFTAMDLRALLEEQLGEIAALQATNKRLAAELQKSVDKELNAFVEILGGRRRILAWVHPDSKPEFAKQFATEQFQKVNAVLERIRAK